MSQKRSNIINETQGDLHLQPSFALVAKKKGKTEALLLQSMGFMVDIRCVGAGRKLKRDDARALM